MSQSVSGGALEGLRIIEMEGIGPGPFAGMMLADHGAEVIRIARKGTRPDPADVLARSRRRVELDLKTDEGRQLARELIATADGVIEGYRPGVMERLGLGPDVLLNDNPRLVYGRMTGWGQEGPLAKAAGHDINYIAITGALNAFGRAGEKPTPPINMVGDFGGGGMMMAFGMLAGILSAQRTGKGQVIDCAMTDGASLLMGMIWGFRGQGLWKDERGVNYLDTGAPYYDTYETSDGQHVAIGSIEKPFYNKLLEVTGLKGDALFEDQDGVDGIEQRRAILTDIFRSKTRDEWCALLEGTDACFAPVLSFTEAPQHPHNVQRKAFIELNGVVQPAPAPRFALTPAPQPRAPDDV